MCYRITSIRNGRRFKLDGSGERGGEVRREVESVMIA